MFDRFVTRLGEGLLGRPRLAASGTVFLASSAGGVYSASTATPPFDETSPVSALGPYGREKLAQEAMVAKLVAHTGVGAVVGRLSNLYGPGQKLGKPQGLVSHIGRNALLRQPVTIYVPLDTIRDYLFAADAGRMVVEAMERFAVERAADAARDVVTKIFASEVDSTVASVLGIWRRVLRRPLRVVLASSPAGALQPRVLSFRSSVWPETVGQPTLLPAGIGLVYRDQFARLMSKGMR